MAEVWGRKNGTDTGGSRKIHVFLPGKDHREDEENPRDTWTHNGNQILFLSYKIINP